MKRTLAPILFVVIFFYSCAAPTRISSNEYLFQDIAAAYDLNDYNIILETKDSIYNLSNITVMPDGKMLAMGATDVIHKKSIVFLSSADAIDVVRHIIDSNNQYLIQVSSESIKRVDLKGKLSGPDKQIIYDENWSSKILLKMAIISTVVGLVVGFIILIFYIIFTIFDALATGCYIATMVYGSYDAPEVLVLRKFRDEKLAPYFWGRVGIRIYYCLSPLFVKIFRNNQIVNSMIKRVLDCWVAKLIQTEA